MALLATAFSDFRRPPSPPVVLPRFSSLLYLALFSFHPLRRSPRPCFFFLPRNRTVDSFRFLSRSRLINRHVGRDELNVPRVCTRQKRSPIKVATAMAARGGPLNWFHGGIYRATLSEIMAGMNKEKCLFSFSLFAPFCLVSPSERFLPSERPQGKREKMEQRKTRTKTAAGIKSPGRATTCLLIDAVARGVRGVYI